MPFHRVFFTVCVALLASSQSLYSQGSIQDQLDDFYQNKTNSWQEYRMIKKPALQEFLSTVSDSIKVRDSKIDEARAEVVQLNTEIKDLNQQLASIKVDLQTSKELNETIGFASLQLSKTTYNVIVWLIIAGLVVVGASLYLMYLRNSSITKEARNQLISVDAEYEEFKEKSREKQAKLKRDLQTALNTLHENRIKM